MITVIIDWLVHAVITTIDFLGYPGVFLLMLLESCGIPAPSEAIMPFSGFLVAEGRFTLWGVVVLGSLGNIVGSWLAWWIGKKGGRPLIEKYGKYILISKHDLDIADRWFAKRGELMVLVGRLLPVIRTYISFPAGISQMSFKKFTFYTTLGVVPWTLLFAWLGVKMGDNWEIIKEKLHNFDMAILILVILAIVVYVARHIKHRRAEKESAS